MKTLSSTPSHRWTQRICLTILILSCACHSAIAASESSSRNNPGPVLAAATPPPVAPHRGANMGIEMAQTVSTVTGAAISPLLGVSAVGAWKFFKTPSGSRSSLPWFAQPWFWIPSLIIVGLCFAKDALGPAVPTALKKPFDVAEVFENKVSALVATGAFVPLILTMSNAFDSAASPLSQEMGLAFVDLSSVQRAILVPFAMAAFIVVWLVSHVINVLILVSPFGTVDAALKAARLALLSTVALTSFASPYAGAVWSCIIIVICYFLAGWAFRLTVLGNVFAWDIVTFRRHRFTPHPSANWAFASDDLTQIPVRTYGRLERLDTGDLVFRYRPWLVLPERVCTLAEGDYTVGRGFLHPELLRSKDGSQVEVLNFPPRMKGHEDDLARIHKLQGVEDVGLAAMWTWLKCLLGFKPAH
ncbi:MAG: hypothetical protein FJ405_16785 [Verrucomicrobia bacterium]|nr:hypothetical protein [Verrucomicrobiota bacterium]